MFQPRGSHGLEVTTEAKKPSAIFICIHSHASKHTLNHLIAWTHNHAWKKKKKSSEELRGLGPQEWSRVSLPARKDEYLAKESQGAIYPKRYEAKTPSAKKKSGDDPQTYFSATFAARVQGHLKKKRHQLCNLCSLTILRQFWEMVIAPLYTSCKYTTFYRDCRPHHANWAGRVMIAIVG